MYNRSVWPSAGARALASSTVASGCRHLGLTCDVRAVPVQTLRGEAIEELLGEHGAQLYSQHGNGDGDDVVLVVMTRVVDEPETPVVR